MGSRKDHLFAISACLAIGAFLAYLRVLRCGFVNYDDAVYTGHPMVQAGITWPSIKWAFASIHASNWHPLTSISHMLDSQIFGQGAAGPHAVNLLLHIASTVLLFLILSLTTKSVWPSAFVAALFAIHPLHVESVAWIAERKDVLSTFFWMLTTSAYVMYTERPSQGRLLKVAGLYALGLMCKPMLVTLPFTLLLLDYWPLRRGYQSSVISDRSRDRARGTKHEARSTVVDLVLEKWPLFTLAVVSSIITYIVQHKGGAAVTLGQIPAGVRIENALISYVMYIWKTVWPAGLAVFYPYPSHPPALLSLLGALLLLVAISVAVFRARERHPYLTVGWLWYVGTLIPVIGLVQVGSQAMADRYTYVPLIGLFVMVAWGAQGLLGKGEAERSTFNVQRSKSRGKPSPPGRPETPGVSLRATGPLPITGEGGCPNTQHPTPNTYLLVPACLIILVLAACTWRQTGYWQDRYTLFSHALDVTKDNYVAHDGVGAELSADNKHMEAIGHFRRAIEIMPKDDLAYNNLGNAYARLGRLVEAVKAYDMAISLRPGFPLSPFNEGIILVLLGRVNDAIDRFQTVLEINRGVRGHPEMFTGNEAKNDAEIARTEGKLRAKPNDPGAKCRYAIALAQRGRLEEAIAELSQVAQSGITAADLQARFRASKRTVRSGQAPARSRTTKKNPNDPMAHFDLGNLYDKAGNRPDAIREFREAIRLKPDFARAHNNLAVALYFTGDYAGAWKEVHLTKQYGAKVHPGFIQALTRKMPDPSN